MEGLALVKVSDLEMVLNEVRAVKITIKELQEQVDLKSYTVQQTAELLGLSYNSVRKLIVKEKLTVRYLNEEEGKGKCTISSRSINEYLTKNLKN